MTKSHTTTAQGGYTPIPTLLAVITAAARAHVPVYLWGDPGIGKSALVRALAANEGMICETVIGSLREPSDFAGLPVVADDGTVSMSPPGWARRLSDAEGGGWLFLDELSTATPTVQKAMLGVVLDRVVGDLPLGRDVRIIAAGNPPETAADGWDLSAPLANRFLHVHYRPAPSVWLDGMVSGFPLVMPEATEPLTGERLAVTVGQIVAFLRVRPELLHAVPTDADALGGAWPSWRTWDMAAKVLAQLTTMDAEHMALSGLVGVGAASEFLTWRANCDLPSPSDLIADPEGFDWASLTPDRAWAALSAVVRLSTYEGTVAAWRAGWKPLAVAAEHNLADVAAACAAQLNRNAPGSALPPKSVKRFAPALAAAGRASSEVA